MSRFRGLFSNWDIGRRHLPFAAAVVCAAFALLAGIFLLPGLTVELSAVTFFAVYLVLIARRIPKLTSTHLKQNAAGTDEPAVVIFAVTFLTVLISLGSLFLALNGGHTDTLAELILPFSAVALGWMTIHTMAAMHYAHRYWSPDMGEAEGGLDFPGDGAPCGYDFLYFSFVIGMTAQTSDVAITTTTMRRVNLLHALVSFFFNTVLVAAAVNAAVSLA